MEEIKISTEFIKLEQLLKLVNIASSGGMAKELILSEKVLVNDNIETRRGKKLRPGDKVQYLDSVYLIK
ncbi:MAG: S4 domain-containing protein YaaA [Lagierella massiliensis]|nr:S4 domain-containing protein YaaA [Lagierella massiliensis]